MKYWFIGSTIGTILGVNMWENYSYWNLVIWATFGVLSIIEAIERGNK